MAQGSNLPTDKKQLAECLYRLAHGAGPYRNKERVKWMILNLYLQGIRDFGSINFLTGAVNVRYPNDAETVIGFKYDGIINTYQTELGRMMQIDIAPRVTRLGRGLDGLRKASIGQIIMNERMPAEKVDRLKETLLPMFIKFGNVAVGAFPVDGQPSLEVIPPWELMGIPAEPADPINVEGLLRVRCVSLDWLRDEKLIKSGDESELEIISLPMGTAPGAQETSSLTGRSSGGSDDSNQKWCWFVECWMRSNDNILKRYMAMAGRKVIRDDSYKNQKVPMPVNVARYIQVGGFYAKGFVEQFIGLNDEVEAMLNQAFSQVENLDLYGMLLASATMGISLEELQEARGGGDKCLLYQESSFDPKIQPFNIAPANVGPFPNQMLQLGLSLMQTQSAQSDLFKGDAPGRVDSSKALSLLYETANIPLNGPMQSLASMMVESYKALLWLTRNLWGDRQAVSLTLSDDALVGVRYNVRSGEIELDQDSVPSPHEVRISIGSKMPQSPTQQRSDLTEALQNGIVTPREYRFKVRELGLDIPVGAEIEWQNYRRAKLENVILYADGESPGKVIVSENDMHVIDIEVLLSFMGGPEFKLASTEVRDAFTHHLKAHQSALGTYPDELPYPGAPEMDSMAPPMEGQEPQYQL